MPDYKNAKIYKLWSPEGDEIYIGSTTESLSRRKTKHKTQKNECASQILFEKYTDVRIELLEECPCDNKEQLLKKEGEYIRNNNCVNKRVAGRTYKERNSIKFVCECGITLTQGCKSRHLKSKRHIKLLEELK